MGPCANFGPGAAITDALEARQRTLKHKCCLWKKTTNKTQGPTLSRAIGLGSGAEITDYSEEV